MIDGLERALVELGRELELPATPDLAAAVAPRLRRRRWWIPAVAAAAAVALAFAVPGSRAEILRFFHLRSVTVELVDTLPQLPVRRGLGRQIDPADAPFRLLLLDGRAPDAVYAGDGGYWLRYPDALLFELRSDAGAFLLKKVAGRVEWVGVGGDPGIWIPDPHGLYLPGGNARTAGRVLLWQHRALTLRLEADVSREAAIRLALSVR